MQQALEAIIIKDEKQADQFIQENEGERIVFEERYSRAAAQAQRIIDKARQSQVIVQHQANDSVENGQENVVERRNKPNYRKSRTLEEREQERER